MSCGWGVGVRTARREAFLKVWFSVKENLVNKSLVGYFSFTGSTVRFTSQLWLVGLQEYNHVLSILSHELLAGVFKSLSNPKQLQVQPVSSGTSFLSQPVNTCSLNLARSTFFCSMVEPWLFKSTIKPAKYSASHDFCPSVLRNFIPVKSVLCWYPLQLEAEAHSHFVPATFAWLQTLTDLTTKRFFVLGLFTLCNTSTVAHVWTSSSYNYLRKCNHYKVLQTMLLTWYFS